MTRDEMRAIVRRDYADRRVRDIADQLGLSRAAVIGMAHRMGLRSARPNRGGWKRTVASRSLSPPPSSCQIVELRAGTCRWPLDDGTFCAAPATRGHYCADHWDRAHLGREQWETTSARGTIGARGQR